LRSQEKAKCTFKPTINKNYNIGLKFEERQKIYKKNQDKRKEE
jgi:hypothetical protein